MELEYYRYQIQKFGVLDLAYMRGWLEDQVKAAGGQRALARRLGVKVWEIGNAMTGARPVSDRLARLLGFDREDHRVIAYRPIPPEPEPSKMTITVVSRRVEPAQ